MKQTLKVGDSETEYESLSEDEVKKIVGDTLDEKLGALEIPKALDTDAFKKDILDSVTNLFEEHKATPLDEDALIKKVEKTFDTSFGKALKGRGGKAEPSEGGWLTRALSG